LILLDSGGLYAALVASERHHEAARRVLEADPGPFVLSPFVLCELDYLLASRLGVAAEVALLDEVARQAYELAPFGAGDVAAAIDVIRRYDDLGIGLTDASIVMLAGRVETTRVLSLDERHFRVLTTPTGEAFSILPADA
jgi:predicted nucleic acid-binding protein